MFLSDAEISKLYENRKSCADIACLGRCSETTIYSRLKHLNFPMRNRSEANKIFPDRVFILLYNLGLSVYQIATLLKINPSTVTKRLHLLSFPLRSRIVAAMIRYTDEEFRKYFLVPKVLDHLKKM